MHLYLNRYVSPPKRNKTAFADYKLHTHSISTNIYISTYCRKNKEMMIWVFPHAIVPFQLEAIVIPYRDHILFNLFKPKVLLVYFPIMLSIILMHTL